ncbi:DUF393 domain-containing protein [Acidobacteria bacterium ACD]|nr:DUF393 domain-containing protein [Acidobacteria bacterium ACD]
MHPPGPEGEEDDGDHDEGGRPVLGGEDEDVGEDREREERRRHQRRGQAAARLPGRPQGPGAGAVPAPVPHPRLVGELALPPLPESVLDEGRGAHGEDQERDEGRRRGEDEAEEVLIAPERPEPGQVDQEPDEPPPREGEEAPLRGGLPLQGGRRFRRQAEGGGLGSAGHTGILLPLPGPPPLAAGPGRADPRAVADHVFYDSECALCHASVRLVLPRDRSDAFRFAPLGGETFRRLVPERDRAGLPDSVVVRTEAGRLIVRSAAVRHLLSRLGPGWRLLGGALGLVPRPLADLGYDLVARVRKRLRRPATACPRVPPSLAARLDP